MLCGIPHLMIRKKILLLIIVTVFKLNQELCKKKNNAITISGHRLGRFDGNLKKITEYLNNPSSDVVSIYNPEVKSDKHFYTIASIPKYIFEGLKPDEWTKSRSSYSQTNAKGVKFSLRTTMSWQIWWDIPISLIKIEEQIEIN